MGHKPAREERVIEFELDLARGTLLAVVVLLALGAAYWAGRASVPEPAAAPAAGVAMRRGVEDLGARRSVFDDAGAQDERREPEKQVTREASQQGNFEIDLGAARDRAEAESTRAAAAAAGVPAAVARDAGGRYRVVGGPFASEAEARRAAAKLAPRLGRTPAVRERAR